MQSWEDRKNAPRYYTKFPEVTEKLVAQTVKRLPAVRETWVRFLGQEDPLEKEMVIHSRTIAWTIPWTEEPGPHPLSMLKDCILLV